MKRLKLTFFALALGIALVSCASVPQTQPEENSLASEKSDVSGKPAGSTSTSSPVLKPGTEVADVPKPAPSEPAKTVNEETRPTSTVATSDDKERSAGKAEMDAAADFMAPSGSKKETGAMPAPAPMATGGSKAGPKAKPQQSGLKASFADDNQQFSYFANFLETYGKDVDHYPLNVSERIVLSVIDAGGKPVHNAIVTLKAAGRQVARMKTYADGTCSIYPAMLGTAESYSAEISGSAGRKSLVISRNGPRKVTVKLDSTRVLPGKVPMDLLFVMDTTGSMGEEIERLRSTIEIIYDNLSAVNPKPEIRMGLVLYKDTTDAEDPEGYRTKLIPFTRDLDAFQAELDKVEASGGGDTPEDLQAALEDAMLRMSWNPEGIRLAFVVTDAPPHLDYGQTYTYAKAAQDARDNAVKIFTVGTGGLPLDGEYILRQISQITQAKYIFLTYGESGESEGGTVGSVSHHTGTNFSSDKLEAIIMKFAKDELAYLSDVPITIDDSWFDAQKIADEKAQDTLGKLFAETLRNLSDYSTYKVSGATRAVVLPVELPKDAEPELKRQAEYFSEQVLLAARSGALFTVVERKDLQKVLAELELQYSMLADEAKAAKLGQLLGGEVLVSGTLYRKGERYELFMKLVRVETGEVLSVAKAKIDLKLGL